MVDLDHVFAGQYTPSSEDKVTEHIGEIEPSLRVPIPAKEIGGFGDWDFTWKRASVTMAFTFLHRCEELNAYGEQIIGLFGALTLAVHSRVLGLD